MTEFRIEDPSEKAKDDFAKNICDMVMKARMDEINFIIAFDRGDGSEILGTTERPQFIVNVVDALLQKLQEI